MTNAEIIEIAALYVGLGQGTVEEADIDLARVRSMDDVERACFVMATKLLAGRDYEVSSDDHDPETIRRARSLAADLGATVEECEHPFAWAGVQGTSVLFTPPSRS
jgi:hypothetical protein